MSRAEGKGRLLVAEDDEKIRSAIGRLFESEFEIVEADDGARALELARALRPEVVICDRQLPGLSGAEVLSALHEEQPGAIRVLIARHGDGQLLAADVGKTPGRVESPFHTIDIQTVVTALHRASTLERERDELQTRLERAASELARHESELAGRDALTGLFNQRSLLEQLTIEIARSLRYNRAFALMVIDIDDFKLVNERHGRAVGDDVLRVVARLLGEEPHGLRRSDISARYDGEQFCVVMPETTAAGGEVKAERVRKTIESYNWPRECPVARVTVSIGVAGFPEHADSAEVLLDRAQRAMRAAKEAGKNRVLVTG